MCASFLSNFFTFSLLRHVHSALRNRKYLLYFVVVVVVKFRFRLSFKSNYISVCSGNAADRPIDHMSVAVS